MKETKKKKKVKTVYLEDDGKTVYSMAALNGMTPEEQEERERQKKEMPEITKGEKRAMITAAFQVYGPLFLGMIACFTAAALLMYFFLR
jgi:hypothetical protein